MSEVQPYSDVPGLSDLPEMAETLFDTLQTIKQLDEVVADLKGQMKAKMEAARVEAVTVPGSQLDPETGERITVVRKVALQKPGVRRMLDPKKLLDLGVKSSVLEAAYTTSAQGESSVRLFTVEK